MHPEQHPIKWNPSYCFHKYIRKMENPRKHCSILESFIEKHPNAHQALIEAGNIHYRAGNYQQAEHYYRQAILHEPDYAVAHNCLGMIYLSRKMEAEAQSLLRNSHQIRSGTAVCTLQPGPSAAHEWKL